MSNIYLEQAKKIRQAINTFAANQTDETLIDNKVAFPLWSGKSITLNIGDIVQYDDDIYRVVQQHTTQIDWTPVNTPALFVRISLEEYPEWIQPTGAQDAYNKGDKCKHNGKKWISDVDANVWEPGAYGWTEEIEG